jgi:hypothetical protein
MDMVVANELNSRRYKVIIYHKDKEATVLKLDEEEANRVDIEDMMTKHILKEFNEFNK